MARLCSLFRSNALRNYALTGELLKILHVFDSQGIDAVVFKGPVLAEFAYGDLALRQFEDLDIAVRRHDVLKAMKLLTQADYSFPAELTERQLTSFVDTNTEMAFFGRRYSVTVDLHWGFFSDRHWLTVDNERVWERMKTTSLLGSVVNNLSAEDQVELVCSHGAIHGWQNLKWVCDVAELVQSHEGLDWNRTIERTASHASKRVLLLGLLLASALLKAPLPDQLD